MPISTWLSFGIEDLTLINGLFVADYLGMLSKYNIEHASYWNIHNDISEKVEIMVISPAPVHPIEIRSQDPHTWLSLWQAGY